jgi:hypothetical protein
MKTQPPASAVRRRSAMKVAYSSSVLVLSEACGGPIQMQRLPASRTCATIAPTRSM